MSGAMLTPEFDQEFAETRKALERVPEDKFDWKPHEKSFTLGGLAGHIAENPGWVAGMIEDEMNLADMGDWKPFAPASKQELLEAYDKNVTTRIGRCPARYVLDRLVPLVQSGRYDLGSVFSHRLPLDRGAEGYAMFDEKRDGCIKIALEPR